MQTRPRTYTPGEYLALEETAEFRSEYHQGEIIPMTGGSFNHNELVTNLTALLKPVLRQQGCRFYSSDVRLWIPRYTRFTYPDAMVIQGEPIAYANRIDTLTNPTLIVDVLSRSTEAYDRHDKFRYYRSIPALQEYVLIDQYEYHIEQFTKTPDGLWLLRDYERDGQPEGEEADIGVLQFSSVGVEIRIADLYSGVNFEPPATTET